MPVQEPDASLIQLPMAGGLDETQDDSFVPPEKSRVCQNVVFPDPTTAAKRPGLTSLATVNYARKLVPHGSEVLVLDPQLAWAYSPTQTAVVLRGPAPQCMISRRFLASGNSKATVSANFGTSIPPCASLAEDPTTHLQIAAWCDGASIQASVFDPVSGNYVATAVQLANTIVSGVPSDTLPKMNPRVIIVGSYAYVIYSSPNYSTSTLAYQSINLANIGGGWSGNTATPVAVYPQTSWDACLCTLLGSGGPIQTVAVGALNATGDFILYIFNASAGALSASSSTTLISHTAHTGSATLVSIACTLPTDGASRVAGVMATTFPTVYFVTCAVSTSTSPSVIASSDCTGLATSTVRSLGVARTGVGGTTDANTTWIYLTSGDYNFNPTGSPLVAQNLSAIQYAVISTDTSTVPGNFYGPFVGYQGLSKPIAITVKGAPACYAALLWQDGQRFEATEDITIAATAAQTIVIVQLQDTGAASNNAPAAPTPVAVAAPRFAGYPLPSNFDVAINTRPTARGSFIGTSPGFTMVGAETDDAGNSSITALDVGFTDPRIGQSVKLGDWTWIAGGLPLIYDGSAITEAGFINRPPTPAVAGTTGTATVPSMTKLQYQYCYSQQDLNGNIHRSPPSGFVILDTSATGFASVSLMIVPYSVTLRQPSASVGSVQIEIYRNNSGNAPTGTPGVMNLVAVIPNDATAPVITFVDSAPDGSNSAAPILYTTGGGVPSVGPPNLSALAVHSDRIFGVSEDGMTVYFTTQFERGEAPRFTDAFTTTWPEGPLTAMWSLEQRLHAATADDIFYIFGDGPNDNGAGSDFTTPSLWQASLGVLDSRGVALYPGGAILSTRKGLYAEDRSGGFTWLSQCRRTLASYPVVAGITPIDAYGTVRVNVLAADGPGQQGLALHYDYRHGKWATHVYKGVTTLGFLSSCVAGGVYYALVASSGSGTLVQETQGTGLDDAAWTPLNVSSGWVNPGGVQGWARLHRVLLFGLQSSPCEVSITLARDYSATFDPTLQTWTDTDLSGLSVLQLQATASAQKVEAVSVQVTDAAPASLAEGTGQGLVPKNVLLRMRGKRGEYKQLSRTERR